jgi:fructose-bisphosphate aldolase, class I
VLARYAAICQECAVVPIVEPEVLMDGDHSLEQCAAVTERVLHSVFDALHRHAVVLEHTVLKPNMVVPGNRHQAQADPQTVANETVRVLRRTVPSAVPAVMFLSGGQTPRQASANLNAMNVLFPDAPWRLSFSYGRALQDAALKAWGGDAANAAVAQQAYLHRARLNWLAALGRYDPQMDTQPDRA